jgi:hypothetical protein
MSNTEPMPLPQGVKAYRQRSSRDAQTRPAPFSPLVEQAMLFTFFAGAASFWMAVIWWILR